MAASSAEPASSKSSFFACYLLCSQNPRCKGRTYIGFTVNPRRRIRQHNGEITSGAWRTKKKRPWEMILCLYGFPTQVNALQFEWAWQHPLRSLAVREAAAGIKSLRGIGGKIKLVYTMLNLPEWRSLDLTINFLSTKHMQFTKGCPTIPPQMQVKIAPLDDLPCYRCSLSESSDSGGEDSQLDEDDGDCSSGDGTQEHADMLVPCKRKGKRQQEEVSQNTGKDPLAAMKYSGDDGCNGNHASDVLETLGKLPGVTASKRKARNKKGGAQEISSPSKRGKKKETTSPCEPKKRGRPKKIKDGELANEEKLAQPNDRLLAPRTTLFSESSNVLRKLNDNDTEQVQREFEQANDKNITGSCCFEKLGNCSQYTSERKDASTCQSPPLPCSPFSWETQNGYAKPDNRGFSVQSALPGVLHRMGTFEKLETVENEGQQDVLMDSLKNDTGGLSTPCWILSRDKFGDDYSFNFSDKKTTEKENFNTALDISQFSPLWSPSPAQAFSSASTKPCLSQLMLGESVNTVSSREIPICSPSVQPFSPRVSRQNSATLPGLPLSPSICCSIITIASTPENGRREVIDLTDSPAV